MESASPPLPPEAPNSTPQAKAKNIFQTLATLCLLSPLIAIGLNFMALNQMENTLPQTREGALVKAIIAGVIPALGILAGLVSLCGIPRHGARGILWKALLGIVIWVLLFWGAFVTAHKLEEIARKVQEQQVHGSP